MLCRIQKFCYNYYYSEWLDCVNPVVGYSLFLFLKVAMIADTRPGPGR